MDSMGKTNITNAEEGSDWQAKFTDAQHEPAEAKCALAEAAESQAETIDDKAITIILQVPEENDALKKRLQPGHCDSMPATEYSSDDDDDDDDMLAAMIYNSSRTAKARAEAANADSSALKHQRQEPPLLPNDPDSHVSQRVVDPRHQTSGSSSNELGDLDHVRNVLPAGTDTPTNQNQRVVDPQHQTSDSSELEDLDHDRNVLPAVTDTPTNQDQRVVDPKHPILDSSELGDFDHDRNVLPAVTDTPANQGQAVKIVAPYIHVPDNTGWAYDQPSYSYGLPVPIANHNPPQTMMSVNYGYGRSHFIPPPRGPPYHYYPMADRRFYVPPYTATTRAPYSSIHKRNIPAEAGNPTKKIKFEAPRLCSVANCCNLSMPEGVCSIHTAHNTHAVGEKERLNAKAIKEAAKGEKREASKAWFSRRNILSELAKTCNHKDCTALVIESTHCWRHSKIIQPDSLPVPTCISKGCKYQAQKGGRTCIMHVAISKVKPMCSAVGCLNNE